jgi:hypothetical protein
MSPEELMILKETIKSMREGNLTDAEKIVFIIGIQAGLYSDDDEIRDLLGEVADLCLISTDDEYKVDKFDN